MVDVILNNSDAMKTMTGAPGGVASYIREKEREKENEKEEGYGEGEVRLGTDVFLFATYTSH